jgi:hypothetical protein
MATLKRYSLSIAAGLLGAVAVQSAALAEEIHFGTGVGGIIGQPDLNVALLSGPGGGLHPFVVQAYPGGYSWAEPFSQTHWVAAGLADNGQDAGYTAAGTYVFALHFTLPEELQAPSLSLQYYADNALSSVTLNGNALTFASADQQIAGHAETANAAFFLAGDNVLNVAVDNWPTESEARTSPLGLDLQGVVAFVPEPASATLVVLGLLLLGRSRKKA